MPKMKTNKSVKKRFRVTKKGKVLGSRALRRHMMTDRSPKKKRQLRRKMPVDKLHVGALKALMPYDR